MKLIYSTSELPTTRPRLENVVSELRELLDEVVHCQWDGVVEEAMDVYCMGMCALSAFLGVPLPVVRNRSIHKWADRIAWYRGWLAEQGLPFEIWMLKFGGNYERPWKRALTKWLAETENRLT